jgi:hypothetical protein
MSALSWATGGVLGCEGWATPMAYSGFVCLLEIEEDEPPISGGGGARVYHDLFQRVHDIYKRKQRDEFDKREPTAKTILREADKEAVKAKVKEFRAMGIKAHEARAMIVDKIQVEIDYQRELRITRLNDEAIALILITVGAE